MARNIMTTLCVLATLAAGSAASAVETKIIGVEGAVSVSSKDHGGQHTASAGQTVAAGDTIMTPADGRAAIAFMAAADTPEKKSDLLLLGPGTKVEITTQADEDGPPILVRVMNGSYRAMVRNGSADAHFAIEAGGRTIDLERADFAGSFSPDTDDARLLCHEGSIVLHEGKRNVKVMHGMDRAIDRGKIRGARRLAPGQWLEVTGPLAVAGVEATMPEPPERAALAKPNKDGKYELVVTPDGVLPKDAVVPTTQGKLNPPRAATPESALEYVRLKTTLGAIVLELDRTRAPISTANFLAYVDEGFYDGTIFHRVISNFMVQGGGFDPGMSKKQTRPGIKNEWQNGLKNVRGSIAMARLGSKADSGTSQFFINVVDNAGLDQPHDGAGYAVFGRVVLGMDVVDAIRNVKTTTVGGYRDVPVDDVVITAAERTTREEALE